MEFLVLNGLRISVCVCVCVQRRERWYSGCLAMDHYYGKQALITRSELWDSSKVTDESFIKVCECPPPPSTLNFVWKAAAKSCCKSCMKSLYQILLYSHTPVGRIWRWEALEEEKVGWCFSTWIVELLHYNAFPFLVVDHWPMCRCMWRRNNMVYNVFWA